VRRFILLTLLAATSSVAFAEWVAVGTSEPSTLYADPASVQKSGDLVKMLDLLDFKTAQVTDKYRYLSSKTLSEYDCKGGQSRILYFSWHSAHMGGGNIVHIDSDSNEWVPISPRSGVEKLWKIACGNK
jgi:hypothetical protein